MSVALRYRIVVTLIDRKRRRISQYNQLLIKPQNKLIIRCFCAQKENFSSISQEKCLAISILHCSIKKKIYFSWNFQALSFFCRLLTMETFEKQIPLPLQSAESPQLSDFTLTRKRTHCWSQSSETTVRDGKINEKRESVAV